MNALKSPKAIITAVCLAVLAGGVFILSAQTSGSSTALTQQSLDLKENADAYTVTLAVPDADASQVRVNLEGRTLRVASGQTASGARFEQSFYLPQADTTKNLSLSREKDRLVISVPKAQGSVAQNNALAPAQPQAHCPPSIPRAQLGSWESQVLEQFARMQRQMDAMFDSALQNFGQDDPFANFIGSGFGNAMPMAGRLQLEDKGDAYVLRASGVDDRTKLDVNVDNGRLLRITTREENSSANGAGSSYSSSSSTQIMTLPTPVKSEQMTTKREGNDVLITLPKA
jgi:HSP20 family molecular chaperone IbpA